MDSAIAFYHAVLVGSKNGEGALAYLHGRGFTDETIATYQLGWAPGGWDTMTRQLAAKRDIRPEELVEVGLASPRQNRNGVYDKFRARVLFPIRDQNGSAVGLGGRLLEGDGPKYLNTPATPLFDKSRTLYLIDRAKSSIRKSGQAVIVEGYTDALMAHQAGFDNVVASLGTALTPGQVALLTRYATRIALAYDVDAAGEKAGTVGVTAIAGLIGQLQHGDSGVKLEDVRVVGLPDGKDPDDVVRETPDEWEAAGREGQAARRVPHRLSRRPVRPQDRGRAHRVRRGGHAVHPRHRRPAPPVRGPRPGPSGVRRGGAHASPGPRASGPQPAHRGPREWGSGGRRAESDQRRGRPGLPGCPADQRHPAGDHAGRERTAPPAAARPGPAAPGRRGARAGPAAQHGRARTVPGDRLPARVGRPGHPPAIRWRGAAPDGR